jgi:serine/threonine protein kinase
LSTPADLIGKVLNNRYTLQKSIGSGLSADIYQAYDAQLQRDVVVKLIRTEIAGIKIELDETWKREPEKAILAADCPNVAQVIDVGESEIRLNGEQDTLHFIVWNYVKGSTLKETVKQRLMKFDADSVIEFAIQLFQAIGTFQEVGFSHGDLHTENILIDPLPEGGFNLRVIDFGTAITLNRAVNPKVDMVFAIKHIMHLMEPSVLGEDQSPLDASILAEVGRYVTHLREELEHRVIPASEVLAKFKSLRNKVIYKREQLKESKTAGTAEADRQASAESGKEGAHVGEMFDELLSRDVGPVRPKALIARGLSGDVYRAEVVGEDRELSLGDVVALKIINPKVTQTDELVKEMREEFKVFRNVRHPNLVHLYRLGSVDLMTGEHHYYVMELVSGKAFRNAMINRDQDDHETAINWIRQILNGMQLVHSLGRMIKFLSPENITLLPDGMLKMMDIGQLKLKDASIMLSQTKMNMRGLYYSSPEQFQTSAVDHRVDFYCLGIVIYEILAGENPFFSRNLAKVMMNHLTIIPPPMSEVAGHIPPGWDAIVQKLLAKNPDDRYQSVEEIFAAIDAVV